MNTRKLLQLAVLLTASLFTASSLAAKDDALLDVLVKKGYLTESEAAQVASESKESKSVFAKPKGKAIKELKIAGRLHFQYDNFSHDDDGNSSQEKAVETPPRLGMDGKRTACREELCRRTRQVRPARKPLPTLLHYCS